MVVTLLFGTVVWDGPFHVPAAQLQLLVWQRQGGICVLFTGDPHAEPAHLQSEEQRDQGCPVEDAGEEESVFLGHDWRHVSKLPET